jgi:hypothetical protein
MAASNTTPLFAALRTFLAVECPGQCCTEIKLKLAHGGRLVLPVPPPPTLVSEERPPPDLTDAILELLDETGPLKTSAIAARLGRGYTGHFRRIIKNLRDASEIELFDGKYRIPGQEPAEGGAP